MKIPPPHRQASKCRRGLTFAELLVAIAIIGILVALLMPAIQFSREAARRMTCQNHLRQMAVAMHSHETVHRHLATGGWGWRWTGEPDRGFAEAQPGGWIYNLLPFIEQNDLRNMGTGQPDPQRGVLLSNASAIALELFHCPSRRAARQFPFVHNVNFVNMTRPAAVARSDYAACSGDQAPDVSFGRGRGPPSIAIGDSPAFVWVETDRTGVVFRRSRVTLGEISDGLSNTYLAGEKYLATAHYFTGLPQNDDQHLFVGYDSDTLRTTDPEHTPLPDSANFVSDHAFGSAHPAGFFMAMADASVQSISYDVDWRVHQARGNRYDGQVASASD